MYIYTQYVYEYLYIYSPLVKYQSRKHDPSNVPNGWPSPFLAGDLREEQGDARGPTGPNGPRDRPLLGIFRWVSPMKIWISPLKTGINHEKMMISPWEIGSSFSNKWGFTINNEDLTGKTCGCDHATLRCGPPLSVGYTPSRAAVMARRSYQVCWSHRLDLVYHAHDWWLTYPNSIGAFLLLYPLAIHGNSRNSMELLHKIKELTGDPATFDGSKSLLKQTPFVLVHFTGA